MSRLFSQAFLTAHELGPIEAIQNAAQAGYDMVSLRLIAATPQEPQPRILEDTTLQNEVKSVLAATGMQLSDIEVIRLRPETIVSGFSSFLAVCQKLGAKHVQVTGNDPDRARLSDNYARFAEMAGQHGLTADLEFMSFTEVKTIADALEIVTHSGADNAAILVDSLHLDRSDSTLDDLRAVPARYINIAQLCDGPVPYDPSVEAMITLARTKRLMPGHGGIDLKGFIAALPPDTPLSVEIPDFERARTQNALERSRLALEATLALLA